MKNLRQIVYLHGTPGSSAELDFLELEASTDKLDIFAPNRRLKDQNQPVSVHYKDLAEDIELRFPSGPIELIGFSLGTFVALQIVPHLTQRIAAVHLIAVAAPLQWSDYLDNMAGKSVFSMARDRPRAFRLLTSVQSIIARHIPKLLGKALFASARGGDVALKSDETFNRIMGRVLQDGLGHNTSTYRKEVCAYVDNWQPPRNLVAEKITFWHGSEDNWSPIGMARDMQTHLGEAVKLKEFPGLSHYSTLYAALAEILELS